MTENTEKTPPRDFELVFGEEKSEQRTETITLEGMKPLEITFEVPDRLARMDIALDASETGLTDPEKVSNGRMILKFLTRYLRGWNLWADRENPPPPCYESLLAMADKHMDALVAMYLVIQGAGADAKN